MTAAAADNAPLLAFGGPYSNLQALRAMRAEAGRLGVPPERTVCTGDVVAYGAHPAETTAEIRDWGCAVVRGNCEESLGDGAGDCGCGFDDGSVCDALSARWFAYADRRIGLAERAWMRGLPATERRRLAGRRIAALHGGARETARFLFASAPDAVLEAELDALDADVAVAGHCGLPFQRRLPSGRVWINAGVIGMPANDGTSDGWFALLTPENDGALRVSLRRLTYDAASAADDLRAARPGDPYADALATGFWPSLDVLPALERAATGRMLAEETQRC